MPFLGMVQYRCCRVLVPRLRFVSEQLLTLTYDCIRIAISMPCSTCATASLRIFLGSVAHVNAQSLQRPLLDFGVRTRRSFHISPYLRIRATEKVPDSSQPSSLRSSSDVDDTYVPFNLRLPSQHDSPPDSSSPSRTWGGDNIIKSVPQRLQPQSLTNLQDDLEPEIQLLDPSDVDSMEAGDGLSVAQVRANVDTQGDYDASSNIGTVRSAQAALRHSGDDNSPGALRKAKDSRISNRERESWQIQKQALSEKFGASGWAPRKRLSPDALEGIRALHAQYPEKYTTPELAQQFAVSPEAIRRILKSKWKPNEEEEVDRRKRWDKRGEAIWSKMVEIGIKPPQKWRQMGVGKDHVPMHKRRGRTAAKQTGPGKQDTDTFAFETGPISQAVSSFGRPNSANAPLSERIL